MSTIEIITIVIPIETDLSYSEQKERFTAEFFRRFLKVTMAYHHGNITKAATALRTDRRFLGKMVKRYLKT